MQGCESSCKNEMAPDPDPELSVFVSMAPELCLFYNMAPAPAVLC